MKIQNVTLGLALSAADFDAASTGVRLVESKIKEAAISLRTVENILRGAGYEVKSARLALNSFEEWLSASDPAVAAEHLRLLHTALENNDISSCSLGNCSDISNLRMVPTVLSISNRFCCSFSVLAPGDSCPPAYDKCAALAETILRLRSTASVDANSFSFCGAFNVSSDSPIGPAAYHDSALAPTVSIALENADLLFLAFHAADSTEEAADNLKSTIRQAVSPLHDIAIKACFEASVQYGGIDLSVQPGNTPQDSVAVGIESLKPHYFGTPGTLSALAVVAAALEEVQQDENIKTCGFGGVCLRVLSDVQLATRAAENPPAFSMQDLLSYTAVSGVGLDCVPISGDVSVAALSALLLDLGALSFRTTKAMMCRWV